MTFRDWLAESRERYQDQPVGDATRESARTLAMGASRRTIDTFLGESIWERDDWDVLCILDACRTDLWDEVAPEYGLETGSRWSVASCSLDWIDREFGDDAPADARTAGYVTANPFSGHSADSAMSVDVTEGEHVRYLDEVYDEWTDVGGGVETIPPEAMTERALWAWRRRDELGIDRLVVHYMQPHQPFRSKPEWIGDASNLANLLEPGREAGPCIWEQTREGLRDEREVWEAYQDNLRWVLDDVTDRLAANCEGTIGLTADHGNGLGAWGVWGHPPGAPTPQVRKVPWATVEGVDDKTVTGSPPPAETDDATDDIADRLEALGYR
ncbi:hypothetical protein HTZ84_22610 [Haloterrigena sp. SYSU A558-1]|uniref:Sulfatase n=1 Tax=Haloterrigena gelatinilytica TaxID=2741724 RepID=A0ABX2LQ84_9EURY|nr:hypothetical protein [Haloterrigena gelatinilytica]NUC75061.1 hypothetical protein [Haloterrigena gelatinilytica]